MTLRRKVRAVAFAALAAASLAGAAWAGPPEAQQGRLARPAGIQTIETLRRIDVNNLNCILSNQGSWGNDIGNVMGAGGEGILYPKGTSNNVVYAAGPWIGGTINDTLHVTVAEYSYEYGPGNIIPRVAGQPLYGVSNTHADPRFIVYKMVRWTGDPADSTHLLRSAEALAADPTADPLVHHSWNEYMTGAVPFGAPWKNYRLPTGTAGDSVTVPGPDVSGDMMCWSVCNDADPALHTNAAGNSGPMGLELQETVFAFNRQGALGNTIFVKYKVINKGLNTLSNAFFSQWSDPDLGLYSANLVGCDTLPDRSGKPRSMGFCYSSTNADPYYGSSPPAVGYDFFLGPKDTLGHVLPMTSFNKYINGTDPASPIASHNYQLGLNSDGTDVVDPFGDVTLYTNAGDPVAPGPRDWLDSSPADRRLMLSSGPFRMAPGDTQDVVVALIVGRGNDRLSSISGLRFYDDYAQAAFDSSFNLPSPPSQPKVVASQDHDQITLSWDAASRTSYNQPGYIFEGYNVYQGATVSGPWKRIATYDEVDNIRVITDAVFDVATGQTINDYPVAFGSDAGVQFSYTATQDAIRGGALLDGTPYFYAVTAYSYNPVGLPKVLENAQTVVRVMPQRPASGTDLNTAGIGPITYLQLDPTKPPTTDQVLVSVVNPELVTGHTYKVSFSHLSSPLSTTVDGVPVVVNDTWSLTDSTTNTVLYSGQLNRLGNTDYRVVDGIQVIENGKYAPALADANYLNLNAAHRRALTGVNWGMPFFYGGGGSEVDFGAFNSTLDPSVQPDSFSTVELRFTAPGQGQNCYRYFRLEKASDGSAPQPMGRSYNYGGFHACDFEVWDTVHNRQLDAFFTERMKTADDGTYLPLASQPVTQDSTWDPGIDGNSDALGTGDREYLCVLNTPYSSTPKAQWATNGAPLSDAGMPMTWFLAGILRTPTDVIDAGDKFVWTWANPANANDEFVFTTTKLQQNNAALAKSRLAAIRAVPNPYYSHSAYELNQFGRVVRFINMPEQCTIRIFNLAGQLVRTLSKTSGAISTIDWDLLTSNQLPVGSGVYIYYVDVPGVGSQIGRVAVFMEKERLNNF